MAKKTFEVALLLTAKDEATRIIAAAAARQRQIMAMSERGDRAFATGRTAGAIGLSIGAALALPLKAAANMETLNTALRSSFQGNAKAAKEAFGEINKFAAQTPFELNEVVTSFLRLKNAGLDPSVKALEAYGNIASSTPGKTLMDFTEAVGDAVMGENERLKEFNISAKKSGDLINYTFQGVTTTVKNNAKDIEKYLQYIGSVKYAGATIAQSKTFNGMMSTLKDNVVMTAASLGDKMLPKMKEYAESLTKSVDKIASWISNNQSLVGTILKVVAGMGALSLTLSAASFLFGGVFKIISAGMSVMNAYRAMMITVTAVQNAMAFSALAGSGALGTLTAVVTALNLAFLANPITWVVLGVVALIAAGYLLIKNWGAVKEFFVNMFNYVAGVFHRFFEVLNKTFLRYTPAVLIYNNWSKIVGFFGNLWDKVKAVFVAYFGFFFGLYKKFWDFGSSIVSGIWDGIKSKIAPLYNFVKGVGKEIANTFKYVLGIASPSKVFMDYGVNITEGAKKGIEKGSPSVVGASKVMGSSIKPTANRGGGGGNSSVSVTFAPVINGGSGDVAGQVKALIPELIRQIEAQMQRKARLAY